MAQFPVVEFAGAFIVVSVGDASGAMGDVVALPVGAAVAGFSCGSGR